MPAYDPRGAGGVHVDVVLSNISVARMNQSVNVADAFFPTVRVESRVTFITCLGAKRGVHTWVVLSVRLLLGQTKYPA